MSGKVDAIDKYRGVIVGMAAGDALGAPLEFGPPRKPDNLLREMVGGGAFHWKPGEWTDDTQMALCIAESLCAREKVDPSDIAQEFVKWFHGNPPDVGSHTRIVLSKIAAGRPWEQASQSAQVSNPNSAGNGSLMRTAPLALFAANADTAQIIEWSHTVSRITHAHEDCLWACAALNVAISRLLKGDTREQALQAARAITAQSSPAVYERLRLASLPTNTTSPSGHVLATLEVAFWSLLHTNSFEDAVVEVVNRGDDSDTVGVVTGALAGAYYGMEAIPKRWRDALLRCDDLVQYADDLNYLSLPGVPRLEYSQIADRLYLGRNPITAADVERLVNDCGITHFLDLREPSEWSPPKLGLSAINRIGKRGTTRLHLPVTDMGPPTDDVLDACIAFISQTLASPDARLYLHCCAGMERSGCVAVAWYASTNGIGYGEALATLREHRSIIKPLPDQEHAVRAWLGRHQ